MSEENKNVYEKIVVDDNEEEIVVRLNDGSIEKNDDYTRSLILEKSIEKSINNDL